MALGACTVLQSEKIDYKSAGTVGPALDVPPDLSQLSRDSRYVVPGAAVTASNYKVGQVAAAAPTAATSLGDIRVERAGTQRWLVVNRPADQLWSPVRDFWQQNGFILTEDQPSLGIMETDWAENRAKLPQDIIRSTIGKVFDSLYSTGERDKYRTRLERTASGGTEIYISHRGMVEVYTSQAKDQTIWEPRPIDPELEVEFLRRLMLRLGASNDEAKLALAPEAASKANARTSTVDNQPVVQLDDGFDRAWRRVGLTLDRTGFTVEDRDRSKGLYFVRYVAPNANKKEPGFFSKLFSKDTTTPPLQYRIAVVSEGTSSTVSVLNSDGKPEASENAKRIVKIIADDLK
ncbi:outer membrane protein assembly factor BamC [Rhodoferax sp.]|uniref:outer membrane protein assembly factor BamC n=1 Tax=Rhodoferax sp. TaxID=50421 RepID=UPI00374CFC52